MPLELEKRENRLFLQSHFVLTLSNMLWFYENNSILDATFFGIYKTARHI